MRHSARWRLFAVYAISLGLMILFLGGALITGLNYSFDKKTAEVMKSIILDVKNDELVDTMTLPRVIDTKEEFLLSPVYIEVYEETPSGKKRVLWTRNMQKHRFPSEMRTGYTERKIPFVSEEDDTALFIQKINDHGSRYLFVVASPLNKIDDTLEHIVFWIITIGLLLYAVVLFQGYRIIGHLLTPIHTMTQTAREISQSSLSKRVPLPKEKDEFLVLANTFNEMLDRIEDSFEKIQRFNANVSHELKTPLTIIRGEIEVALKKQRKREEYETLMGSILEEVETMQSIIDTMLMLSKTDTKSLRNRFGPVDLEEIVEKAIEGKKQAAGRREIRLHLRSYKPARILGEPMLLKQAVDNLIDNAIKYSPEGSPVTLEMHSSSPAEIILTIKDSGWGIGKDELERIFDPFYRIDSSHSKATPGQGLGLSIVQWIIRLHQAEISVESEEGKGTLFTMRFKAF